MIIQLVEEDLKFPQAILLLLLISFYSLRGILLPHLQGILVSAELCALAGGQSVLFV